MGGKLGAAGLRRTKTVHKKPPWGRDVGPTLQITLPGEAARPSTQVPPPRRKCSPCRTFLWPWLPHNRSSFAVPSGHTEQSRREARHPRGILGRCHGATAFVSWNCAQEVPFQVATFPGHSPLSKTDLWPQKGPESQRRSTKATLTAPALEATKENCAPREHKTPMGLKHPKRQAIFSRTPTAPVGFALALMSARWESLR